MEFKREGFIFGVAARMFSIAGPVLVYGVGSSVVVGILYLILTKEGDTMALKRIGSQTVKLSSPPSIMVLPLLWDQRKGRAL